MKAFLQKHWIWIAVALLALFIWQVFRSGLSSAGGDLWKSIKTIIFTIALIAAALCLVCLFEFALIPALLFAGLALLIANFITGWFGGPVTGKSGFAGDNKLYASIPRQQPPSTNFSASTGGGINDPNGARGPGSGFDYNSGNE